MAKSTAFFVTSGKSIAFLNTFRDDPVFLTSKKATAFINTLDNSSVFVTSSRSLAFLNTFLSTPVFASSSQAVAFLTTVFTGTQRDLVLKIGTLDIATDQSSVTVPDDTGTYDPNDPDLNPGGYNPETEPTEQYRPKRSEVHLWTVFRLHTRTTAEGYGDNTITPSTQTPEDNPNYEYTLFLPTEVDADGNAVPIGGIYEIILIAAPLTENYTNYIGNTNLYSIASQYPGWYVTSVGALIDAAVINCIQNMRYKFLQSVMCGKCDDEYLTLYAYYVGMLEAMNVQEWARADEFYKKIKEMCASNDACSCNC